MGLSLDPGIDIYICGDEAVGKKISFCEILQVDTIHKYLCISKSKVVIL